MIEVLFGENEAESMNAAKCLKLTQNGHLDGPASVFKRPGVEIPAKVPFTGFMQGTPEEVVCLDFMLDIGDIKDPIDSRYRENLIFSMYSQNAYEVSDQVTDALKTRGEKYSNELKRLKKFFDNDEEVRIWYSDLPYSICGFYSLCQLMQNYHNEIHVVKLPEYVISKSGLYVCSGWSDVSAEEFAAFLSYEKILTSQEVGFYAQKWRKLTEENSPLRAVINGSVISVPENFYDFLIWNELSDGPIREGKMIGDILCRYQLGAYYWWFARRIERLIRAGTIIVTEDSENSYARMLSLC
ncbi:MAG: DUF3658 domain-containing protein [Candidatus Weimeria sp.]